MGFNRAYLLTESLESRTIYTFCSIGRCILCQSEGRGLKTFFSEHSFQISFSFLNIVEWESRMKGLELNSKKTEFMVVSRKPEVKCNITINGAKLKQI